MQATAQIMDTVLITQQTKGQRGIITLQTNYPEISIFSHWASR